MQSGKLRERITIQSFTGTADNYGQEVKSWSTFKEVWAAVEPTQGREFWAGQQVQSEVTMRVRIRYLAGVLPEMRILWGTKVLNIAQIINPKARDREMQIMCSEGVNQG